MKIRMILLILLCLAASVKGSLAEENIAETGWKTLYANQIIACVQHFNQSQLEDYSLSVMLIDLDNDKIPELYVGYVWMAMQIPGATTNYLYSIKDGKVIEVLVKFGDNFLNFRPWELEDHDDRNWFYLLKDNATGEVFAARKQLMNEGSYDYGLMIEKLSYTPNGLTNQTLLYDMPSFAGDLYDDESKLESYYNLQTQNFLKGYTVLEKNIQYAFSLQRDAEELLGSKSFITTDYNSIYKLIDNYKSPAARTGAVQVKMETYRFDSQMIDIVYEYPIVTVPDNPDAEDKINRTILRLIDIDEERFRDLEHTYTEKDGVYSLAHHIKFENEFSDQRFLSFYTTNHYFGAIRNYDESGFTFDLHTGELVQLSDIVNDIDAFRTYASAEISEEVRRMDDGRYSNDGNEIEEAMKHYSSVFISDDTDEWFTVWYMTDRNKLDFILPGIAFTVFGDNQWEQINVVIPDAMLKSDIDPIKVIVNGTEVAFDQLPFIRNGRTLVPMRAIFEALGCEVQWNEQDQSISAVRSDREITMKIGLESMHVRSKEPDGSGYAVGVDTAPQIINGRTFVPIRAISEALGCKVIWDETAREITITSSIPISRSPAAVYSQMATS